MFQKRIHTDRNCKLDLSKQRWLLKITLYIAFLLLIQDALYAQTTQVEKSVLYSEIKQLSIDRYHFIYAAGANGKVYKLDSLAKELAVYSPNQNNSIDLIEAWQGIRIFLFYEDLQGYALCDRFLGNCIPNQFPESVSFVNCATMAGDGNIWLFDQDEFALKKVAVATGQTLVTNPLDLVITEEDFSVRFMREYQNHLYASSDTKFYQFDLFGNLTQSWEISGMEWFGFINERCYYLNGTTLTSFDLYREAKETYMLEKAYQQVLWMNKDLLIGLTTEGNQVDWIRLNQIKD